MALLNAEPGSEVVASALPGATISTVNLAEVFAKLDEVGISGTAARSALDGLGLVVHPFDGEQAFTTGMLRSKTRALGLSLGDRACLALGGHLRKPVLTADRAWRELKLGIEVRAIR